MAWVRVETNQSRIILQVNTALYDLTTHCGIEKLEADVIEAVLAAVRMEMPLESLEDEE